MKKVITQGVLEEAKYFCDKHPERECYSHLTTLSWYGSRNDLTGVEIHLCDDCLEEAFKWLEEKFGAKVKEIDL